LQVNEGADTLPERIIAYIDGGSRGNPGPAAAAFTLFSSGGAQVTAKGFFLGEATNNTAEYTGLIKALEAARQAGGKELTVFSDSELLVRQINGQYRVKSEQIKPLFQKAVKLLDGFESWQVRHIPREKNKRADELVNQALDVKQEVEPRSQGGVHNQKHIRLGVLISGGGTTLMNILEYIRRGELNSEVGVVISSRSTAAGVERAKNAGLNVEIIRRKDSGDIEEFSKRIEDALAGADVDLVVQGGWLCLWKIPDRYENRVMNIHPALLPSFGGQGMWGHHVHEAVLGAGCKVSGCTVHFCTNEYDKGPIIIQRCCEVKDDDTADSLSARVFEQECIAYPQAIKLFAEDRIMIRNGVTRVKP
jgi:formyltetrahydrofolate-dependent phosphoribosylglycinamide formyltransferase